MSTSIWKIVLRTVAFTVPVTAATLDIFGYPAVVEGCSMQPSFNPNGCGKGATTDVVFLNRYAVRNFDIQRGEIVSLRTRPPYKNRQVTVPVGHCWVEGDNQSTSLDSNHFGPVGKAAFYPNNDENSGLNEPPKDSDTPESSADYSPAPKRAKENRIVAEDQLEKQSTKEETIERSDNSSGSEAEKKDLIGEEAEPAAQKDMPPGLKYIGAHVSIAGGIWKAVEEAASLGAASFGMFLKGQRQWKSKPLADEDAQKFRDACEKHGYAPRHIVPHGSYLMNCGSVKKEQFDKSRAMLLDELQRCEKLGLTLFNFHPGSTCGETTREDSIARIAECINYALENTKGVTAVLENMCCQGHTLGGDLKELRAIIDLVEDKSRVGVCIDTCHAHAAGFDLSEQEGYDQLMADLENTIGLKYLLAVHINDSKGKAGCHLDRHENIGKGTIKLEGFRRFMNDDRFNDIPFILETPLGDYSKEIRKLYSLVKDE